MSTGPRSVDAPGPSAATSAPLKLIRTSAFCFVSAEELELLLSRLEARTTARRAHGRAAASSHTLLPPAPRPQQRNGIVEPRASKLERDFVPGDVPAADTPNKQQTERSPEGSPPDLRAVARCDALAAFHRSCAAGQAPGSQSVDL